jgi:hypothetical protein
MASRAAVLTAAGVALGVAVTGFGCASGPVVTAAELPTVPRHPDGVLLEPPPALPTPEDRAEARGVVLLREPLGPEAVRHLVTDFLHAFVQEDIDALLTLLLPNAGPLDGPRRGTLRDTWYARMRSFDYSKLSGEEIAHFDQIERAEYDDLGEPGEPPRPTMMRRGDVLVRVPIATPRVGTDQVFPEVLILLLRRDEGRFKIAGVGEENGP